MASWLTSLDGLVLVVALYLVGRWLSTSRSKQLPPGPRGLPLLGNLLQWPTSKEWETFTRWSELYGSIVHCKLLHQHVIILNDPDTAFALLDRKGSIYSDRPELYMANKLIGWEGAPALTSANAHHRTMRTMMARTVGTKALLRKYEPMLMFETKRFLRKVLREPENLYAHVRWLPGAEILNISHGYQVKEKDDPLIQLAETAMEDFSRVTVANAELVDAIPALDKLPRWFPGTGFRDRAAAMRKTLYDFLNVPHAFVRKQMADGVARPSFVQQQLEKGISPEEEEVVKFTALGLYGGGSDTSVSAIASFFLAMTLYPEVQEMAQKEIERAVGRERLPTLEDRERLPYVDALVKEVFRWGCILPLCIPHVAREDDVHEDYFIPKGSIIIPNIWKYTHDGNVYSDPMSFKPERFLATPTHQPPPDPKQYIFGFGRRVCPGMHIADNSVWIACAASLAVLTVGKAVDADGREITPEVEFVGQLITHPKEFPCNVRPRSTAAQGLVDDGQAH